MPRQSVVQFRSGPKEETRNQRTPGPRRSGPEEKMHKCDFTVSLRLLQSEIKDSGFRPIRSAAVMVVVVVVVNDWKAEKKKMLPRQAR